MVSTTAHLKGVGFPREPHQLAGAPLEARLGRMRAAVPAVGVAASWVLARGRAVALLAPSGEPLGPATVDLDELLDLAAAEAFGTAHDLGAAVEVRPGEVAVEVDSWAAWWRLLGNLAPSAPGGGAADPGGWSSWTWTPPRRDPWAAPAVALGDEAVARLSAATTALADLGGHLLGDLAEPVEVVAREYVPGVRVLGAGDLLVLHQTRPDGSRLTEGPPNRTPFAPWLGDALAGA